MITAAERRENYERKYGEVYDVLRLAERHMNEYNECTSCTFSIVLYPQHHIDVAVRELNNLGYSVFIEGSNMTIRW